MTQSVSLRPNTFFCIGNLADLFDEKIFKLKCQNRSSCKDLNLIFCYFVKMYCFHRKDGLKLFTSFSSHHHFRSVSKPLLDKLLGTFLPSRPAECVSLTNRIGEFLLDPLAYLRKRSFMTLSREEQIIALLFLIRRQEFILPPKCFCNDIFKCNLAKESPKRKHDAIRYFLKVYMSHVIAQCLPAEDSRKPKKIRHKRFISAFNREFPGGQSTVLLKTFLNSNFKFFSLKSTHPKSLTNLFQVMRRNPLTRQYFDRSAILRESTQLINLYEKQRKNKIESFIKKFPNGSFERVFGRAVELLKKKRVKLFFSKKDVQMAMSTILQLLTSN